MVTMTCPTCGQTYVRRGRRAKHCSLRCAKIAMHKRLGRTVTLACATCGNNFVKPKSMGMTKYCSRNCYRTRPTRYSRTFSCAHCGTEVSRDYRGKRALYCSMACRADAQRTGGSVSSQGYRVQSIKGKPVLEHRLVMERHLGRKLLRSESIHHLDGDRLNNALVNLELWYQAQKPGQRAADLIAYVMIYHRAAAIAVLESEGYHVTAP